LGYKSQTNRCVALTVIATELYVGVVAGAGAGKRDGWTPMDEFLGTSSPLAVFSLQRRL